MNQSLNDVIMLPGIYALFVFFKGQGDIRRAGGDRVEVAGIICSVKKVN